MRPEFVAGVRRCGVAGLLFEICCVADQLPKVVELVRACPDTRFILGHAGKPDIRSSRLDAWSHQIDVLAAFPNVVAKLSALVTQARHDAWQIADLQPCWDHLVRTFGPGRLLFGSDWFRREAGLALSPLARHRDGAGGSVVQ